MLHNVYNPNFSVLQERCPFGVAGYNMIIMDTTVLRHARLTAGKMQLAVFPEGCILPSVAG